jgi:hypothetical protein
MAGSSLTNLSGQWRRLSAKQQLHLVVRCLVRYAAALMDGPDKSQPFAASATKTEINFIQFLFVLSPIDRPIK